MGPKEGEEGEEEERREGEEGERGGREEDEEEWVSNYIQLLCTLTIELNSPDKLYILQASSSSFPSSLTVHQSSPVPNPHQ